MCHRPASLGHEEQSSGAHGPALSEKQNICLNQIEGARHPAKKHLGWKAIRDSESWDKVRAPIPWFMRKLCPPPGAWLHCLSLEAPTVVPALPAVPIPMSMLLVQCSALPEPVPGARQRRAAEAVCPFGTVSATETAFLKCT